MKKLTALFLLLVLLTGCSHPAAPTEASTLPGPSETAPRTLPLETTLAPAEPSLMAGREQVGDHLYRLHSQTVEALDWVSALYVWGDCLLIGSPTNRRTAEQAFPTGMNYLLQLLDLKTGELRAEALIENSSAPSLQLCGDRIAVSDSQNKQLQLLDRDLEQVAAYPLPDPLSQGFLSTDAACYYSFVNGRLLKTDLATGTAEQLLPTASDIYFGSLCSGTATFSCKEEGESSSHFACIDLATGEIRQPPYQTLFSNLICNGDNWLGLMVGTNSVYYLGCSGQEGFLHPGEQFCNLVDGPAPLLLSSYRQSVTHSLYRADGSCLGSFTLDPRGGTVSEPVWCAALDGYFLLLQDGQGGSSLLFWQPGQTAGGEALEIMPMSAISPAPGRTAAQQLYDRAQRLSEQYAVTVRIADQCDTAYQTFDTDPISDYWTISSALNTLEKALQAYPRGFLEQLLYGDYTETQINLTGAIHDRLVPEDANGFTSFSAYVEHSSPLHIMVLDITQYGLEQTIYHEFSHIIDAKLEFDTMRGEHLYSEYDWACLNPDGFDYLWTVYQVPDSYYTDGYDGYFVDTYARTFPTEDRARILEYAMAGHTWVFEGPSQQPLRDKLAFYSACIRDSFDTTGWPAVTVWEQPLQAQAPAA